MEESLFVAPWAKLGTAGRFVCDSCKRNFLCVREMRSVEFPDGQIRPEVPTRHPKAKVKELDV